MIKPNIAIIGCFLESNRFSPVTTEDDFKRTCFFTGEDILKEAMRPVPSIKSEAVSFVRTMNDTGPWNPVPILFTYSTPGGPIAHDFFRETLKYMEDKLKACSRLDGVYIANHGAMSSTETTDPDGMIYEMVRMTVGDGVPIISTVDLHANISPRMFHNADVIISYRTNPHVDAGERAADAASLMLEMVQGLKLTKALVPTPICAPTVRLLTEDGPYGDLIKEGQKLIDPDLKVCSVVGGFVFTDAPECGIKILAYGHGDRPAHVAERLARLAWQDRARYKVTLTPLDKAIKAAKEAFTNPALPAVCLADVADNPGGGGGGNTMDILEGLLDLEVQSSLLGAFYDAPLAEACHQAGEGAEFEAVFNSQTDTVFARRLKRKVRVLKLSNGEIIGRRGVVAGKAISLGLSAAVQVGGVTVVVTSRRTACNDPMYFNALGQDPSCFRSVVIKSRGHFRAGFDEVFSDDQIIEVDADGLTTPVLSRLDFQGLKRPCYPLDGEFDWDIPPAIEEE